MTADEHTKDEELRPVPIALNAAGQGFLRTLRHGPGAVPDERLPVTVRRSEREGEATVCHAGDAIGSLTGQAGEEVSALFEECGRRRIEASCDTIDAQALVEEPAEEPGRPLSLSVLLPSKERLLHDLVMRG